MNVFLAADHRGFKLKEELKAALAAAGYAVEDTGAFTLHSGDDYPDFAATAAMKIAADPGARRGIFLCGSGTGMDVVANKFKGIRATVACSAEAVRRARADDDVNAIAIAADTTGAAAARAIATAFLETPFSGEERHVRRLKKISEIEKENFK